MKRHIKIMAVVVAMAGGIAHATPVIDSPESWGSGIAGWTVQQPVGTSPTLSNPSGALQVTFPSQGSPLVGSAVIAANSSSSGGKFTGDYSLYGSQLAVSFQLNAIDQIPNYLGLYFYSSTSGRTWQYSLTTPGSLGLSSYRILMDSALVDDFSGWHLAAPGALASDFLSDLQDVDWIGVYISRYVSTGEGNYQLDDFTLTIPEPETILVLLAAIIPMAITFRGQLAGLFGLLKGLVK